jgi:hypothetical protein
MLFLIFFFLPISKMTGTNDDDGVCRRGSSLPYELHAWYFLLKTIQSRE